MLELSSDQPSSRLSVRMCSEIVVSTIDKFISDCYDFIWSNPSEWRLDGNCDLEVTNHVLRVFIQDNSIADHADQLQALVAVQHSDGGWGDLRDDQLSHERATAFCVQMLLRAERQAPEPWLAAAIVRGLEFIASRQRPDGSWEDHRWHRLDAVSTSVGTLLFAVNDAKGRFARFAPALERGMAFVDAARDQSGLWYYKPRSSPVTITAHLIQKTIIYHGDTPLNRAAMRGLIAMQDPDGHWDNRNTDHTCDASRSLMLAASKCGDAGLVEDVRVAAECALRWLIESAGPTGGLGDRPGRKPHVERSCDGLDTALKFKTFLAEHEQMSRFWN